MIRALIAILTFKLTAFPLAEYACRPYQPIESCEVSLYEFTVRDITEPGKPEIAKGKAECVLRDGRYVIPISGVFSVKRVDRFDEPFGKLTLPAAQTSVCKWN